MADDHPIVRVGIVAIINARPDMMTVAQAGTAEEAIQLFDQHLPDITLMDLRLPKMSEVDAIRAVRIVASSPGLHPAALLLMSS